MLFPQLGPQYYDERHRGILSQMEASYAETITIQQALWAESDTNTRFYCNDQTMWNDLYGNLPINRRRNFSFNRIRPIVSMIEGYQRRNRKSSVCIPIENGDGTTADQFTKILLWINNQEGVLETISDTFRDTLITGMNLLRVWMDYRNDPINGNIKVDKVNTNAIMIDPYFKKKDLSDCNFVWTRTYLNKRQCISLLPEYTTEILGLIGNDNGSGRDGKFQFQAESYLYGQKNLLTYDEYYYRDFRHQKLLVDTETGETQEWRSEKDEGLRYFLSVYPQIKVIESEVPTTKLAIVIQGKVFYSGPNPMGIDQYPFVPVLAYYQPEIPYMEYRTQGIVQGLRDAQYLYNRRRIIELDILESQVNSGYKFKEGAFVNPKDAFLQGQGRGIAIKDEAQMSDVEQIVAPAIPASMIQLSELLGKEIQTISGVNEELLGSAVDDKAGILSMLRQGAGLTTLQGLFDNLDYAQKLLGKLIIDLIQTNFTPGKVKKILEGEEPAPQFYNKAFGKYNCTVEDGLNTSTQKQMQFAQLLYLREVGIDIPIDALLQASTLQNKQKLIDTITQKQQQQAQMQQAQNEISMKEIQSRIDLAEARTVADKGLGVERISRVEENRALAQERLAASEKDKDMALLNLVKALKEIDTVDLQQLEKLLSLQNLVKEHNAPSETASPVIDSQSPLEIP